MTKTVGFTALLLVIISTFLALDVNALGTTSVSRCVVDFKKAKSMIAVLLRKTPNLAAAFIRASFHDCFTASRDRAQSGCNGSLRLRIELKSTKNGGIEILLAAIEPILRKTCISTADAIQMGAEEALKVTGGIHLSLGRSRVDAINPDKVESELPGLSKFKTLKALYAQKGFNVRELVVSNIGGHSLGKFFGIAFSPLPNKFDNMHAVNLLHVLRTKSDMRGFNTLPSDRELIADPEGLLWVKFYGDQSMTKTKKRLGVVRLRKDFAAFMVKQSRMKF